MRQRLRRAASTGIWRPASAQLILRDLLSRDENPRSDAEHLRAAAEWLRRAQAASSDGGVSGRYFLASGWSPSYPETTGYIVPTFLGLATWLDDAAWTERAERAIAFLRRLQGPDGSFPGGEIGPVRRSPSVFNTGQILNGLVAWAQATGDDGVLDAARRAGRWLCSVQESDGSFREATYLGVPATYHAHAVCWLADLAVLLDDLPMQAAVRRHLEWCLAQYDREARWLDLAGFSEDDHQNRRAFTHTFAYALFGSLHAAHQLGMAEVVEMVRDVADRAAELTVQEGRLPGTVNARWSADDRSTCLTGSAQMAMVWLRLEEAFPHPVWRSAASIVVDGIKRAQPMRSRDDGIRGGIPGSRPVWGDYIPFALPNWAAKFFVDVLLMREGEHQPGRVDLA